MLGLQRPGAHLFLTFLLSVTRPGLILLCCLGGNSTTFPAQLSQKSPGFVPAVILPVTSCAPLQAIIEVTFDLLDLSFTRTESLVDRALGAYEEVRAATCPLGPKEASGQFHLTCLRLKRLCLPMSLLTRTAVKPGWLKKTAVINCPCFWKQSDRRAGSQEATGKEVSQGSLLWHR